MASIFKSDIPGSYKIIVVNDCSTDITAKFLTHLIKKEGRPIEIIENKNNLGYVHSTNRALKEVKSEFILLLNNDIILDKDCIKNLLKAYQKDFGILGATQYDYKWRELSPLKYFKRGEEATTRDHIVVKNLPKDLNKEVNIIYTDDVHLGCALLNKNVLDKVGLLDEQFAPGNYEQEDWCLRMKEAGFLVGICPMAKYIHLVGISALDKAIKYTNALNRNRKLFHRKWGEKLRKNEI